MADVLGLSDVSSKDTGRGKQLKTGNLKRSYNMPKACVKKKIKGGMSPAKAVAACYPKATKAAKSAILAVMPGTGIGSRVAKHLVKKATKKEIAMSKPKKLSLRRDVPEMEKRRRRSKAKSMSVAPKQQSTSKKKSKKKSKRRKGGILGRDY